MFNDKKYALSLQLIIYVVLVYALTYGIGQWVFRASPSVVVSWIRAHWILVLMYLPAFTAFFCWILFWQGLPRFQIQLPKLSYVVWSIVIPFTVTSIVYSLGWLFNLTELSPEIGSAPLWQNVHGWFTIETLPFDNNLALRILFRFALIFSLGMLPHLFYSFGEEIGWRGYMQPRLNRSQWVFPLWIGGFIWAQWHFPFLLVNPQATIWINALWIVQFTIVITLLGVFYRLVTDSLR